MLLLFQMENNVIYAVAFLFSRKLLIIQKKKTLLQMRLSRSKSLFNQVDRVFSKITKFIFF